MVPAIMSCQESFSRFQPAQKNPRNITSAEKKLASDRTSATAKSSCRPSRRKIFIPKTIPPIVVPFHVHMPTWYATHANGKNGGERVTAPAAPTRRKSKKVAANRSQNPARGRIVTSAEARAAASPGITGGVGLAVGGVETTALLVRLLPRLPPSERKARNNASVAAPKPSGAIITQASNPRIGMM